MVTEPPKLTMPPVIKPVPALTVIEELANSALSIWPVGRETVPAATVKPLLNLPAPIASRTKPLVGVVVPMPTVPAEVTTKAGVAAPVGFKYIAPAAVEMVVVAEPVMMAVPVEVEEMVRYFPASYMRAS